MSQPTRPRRLLYVLTSHGVLGDTGRPTGYHLGETAHPWRIARDAGYEVDFASVRGGRPPMVGYDPADPVQREFLDDSDVRAALARTMTPEQADPAGYAAVYFVGGHGTMWDFPGGTALAALAARIYEAGGVVAAICHGPAALVDVRLSDGRLLVAGRRVTAFSDADEAARGLADIVPFALQSALERRGARYSCAPDKVAHVVVDGRLVTGQNPASAVGLGAAVVDLLRVDASVGR